MTQHYRYKCPIPTCKVKADLALEPSYAPWCNQESHSKEMVFLPDESTGTPAHVNKKTKKT